MIRVALLVGAFAFAAGLAACAEQKQTLRDLDQITRDNRADPSEQPDTCQMAQHQNFIGMDQTAIDAAGLPANARVICYGCMATQDHNSRRLNLQLGRDGQVASLRCG